SRFRYQPVQNDELSIKTCNLFCAHFLLFCDHSSERFDGGVQRSSERRALFHTLINRKGERIRRLRHIADFDRQPLAGFIVGFIDNDVLEKTRISRGTVVRGIEHDDPTFRIHGNRVFVILTVSVPVNVGVIEELPQRFLTQHIGVRFGTALIRHPRSCLNSSSRSYLPLFCCRFSPMRVSHSRWESMATRRMFCIASCSACQWAPALVRIRSCLLSK